MKTYTVPNKVHVPKKVQKRNQKGFESVTKLGTSKDNTKDNTKDIACDSVESRGTIESFLSFFAELFQSRFGSAYHIRSAKEKQSVGRMLSSIGLEDLKSRAEKFIKDEDDFVKKAGHTIGVFESRVNKYVVARRSETKGYVPDPPMSDEERQRTKEARDEMFRKLRNDGLRN